MEKAVTVYSAPGCPICKAAKDFLAERNVAFDDFDVTSDAAAFAKMRQVSGGLRSVPVIVVGGAVVAGFDEKELVRALEASGRPAGPA